MRYLTLTVTELPGDLGTEITSVTEQISRTQEYMDRYLPSVVSFGLRLLFAVIVFLIGTKLIKFLRKIIRSSMERAGADVGVIQFLDSLLKVIFYFVLIMLIASGFGVDTTSVMALVGSAGLTIGLAFQGSLSNFAGGVLILLIKPFKVGQSGGDRIRDTNVLYNPSYGGQPEGRDSKRSSVQ